MKTIKHKLFGEGTVIAQEIKDIGSYITVRFEKGRETRFAIPESLTTGMIIAEGTLKNEVDAAIADKNERERIVRESRVDSTPVRGYRAPRYRTGAAVLTAGDKRVRDAYESYLVSEAYTELTTKGGPSTVEELWVDTNYTHRATKMHPVMSVANTVVYWVSEDECTLCFDVGDAFGGRRLRRPIRYYSTEERTEMIHAYLENNLPTFYNKVNTLILKMGRFDETENFAIDAVKLKELFPNLGSVYCNDKFEILHAEDRLYILDPFDLGEMAFNLAQDKDFEMANNFTRELWALDHKWARFFREVAVDFRLSRDEHLKHYPNINVGSTGLDKLFRIYLLGWYFESGVPGSFDDDRKVYANKYRNYGKAIEILAVRFRNWNLCDISEKLNWDLSHCAHDADFKYEMFAKVILETERLYPGTLDQLQKDGMEEEEVRRLRVMIANESKE